MKKLNLKDYFKKAEDWLYASGFDDGFKDKALQPPFIALVVALMAAFYLVREGAGQAAVVKSLAAEAGSKVKMIEDYRYARSLWVGMTKGLFLPQDKDAREWMHNQVTSMAKAANIEIVSSNPGELVALGKLRWQQASFEISGSYHDLGRLVASIENSRPFLGIASLSINKPVQSEGAGTDKSGLAIRLDTFVLMENSQPAGGT
ncbi:MAG: hypothetical protein HY747_08600 [Elusimicrobia bacterium]|nr:hypothetical protein [Elusimicrobiota bacterium]